MYLMANTGHLGRTLNALTPTFGAQRRENFSQRMCFGKLATLTVLPVIAFMYTCKTGRTTLHFLELANAVRRNRSFAKDAKKELAKKI
jgi:sorbitol-specific phosphotransferase system component IIC